MLTPLPRQHHCHRLSSPHHQMHIHIASPKTNFGVGIPTTLAKFGNDWIQVDATKYKDKLMQCPTAGHTVSFRHAAECLRQQLAAYIVFCPTSVGLRCCHTRADLVSCPQPKPFSALSEAVSRGKWPITTGQGIKPWESTTVALIKPDFCKGGNTCDHCYLMLYHVGDRDILNY
jgi:hypothetical protein